METTSSKVPTKWKQRGFKLRINKGVKTSPPCSVDFNNTQSYSLWNETEGESTVSQKSPSCSAEKWNFITSNYTNWFIWNDLLTIELTFAAPLSALSQQGTTAWPTRAKASRNALHNIAVGPAITDIVVHLIPVLLKKMTKKSGMFFSFNLFSMLVSFSPLFSV